ncbi:ATP-binding cassette domain-containing protein [Quadrisphaera sp. INWT6]|nr:ATP-binding cassette domain-containing protein [Quadrisphaera sp. INWT6]
MTFGTTEVIRDLSFTVHPGETFGFLGSNGSGKTTTIRALLGIYRPTRGRLLINGRTYTPDSGLRLGYLPEERGLYKKEPVLDVMTYFGRLRGMSTTAARTWSLAYLERVELAEKAKTRLDKLSGGQQQKVQLGVTIMHDPQLLILDEPTKGFDPVNRRLLMDIIAEQQATGATVVMVTHQMEEVERLCDRVLLLKDGVARAYGSVTEVQDSFAAPAVHIEHTGHLPAGPWRVRPAPATSRRSAHQRSAGGLVDAADEAAHLDAASNAATNAASPWGGVRSGGVRSGGVRSGEPDPTAGLGGAEAPAVQVSTVELNGGVSAGQALQHLVAAGADVSGFTVVRTSLEDIFVQVYGDHSDHSPQSHTPGSSPELTSGGTAASTSRPTPGPAVTSPQEGPQR